MNKPRLKKRVWTHPDWENCIVGMTRKEAAAFCEKRRVHLLHYYWRKFTRKELREMPEGDL